MLSFSDLIAMVLVALLAFHAGTYSENMLAGSTAPSSTIVDLFHTLSTGTSATTSDSSSSAPPPSIQNIAKFAAMVAEDENAQTDSSTGLAFPSTLPFYVSKRPSLALMGVGTRKLAILNVYSLGLYMSAPVVKSLQSSADSTLKSCTDNILDSTAPKAVLMQFSMTVGPERIAEALSQVKNAAEDVKKKLYDIIVDGMMEEGKMKKREQMTLEWKGRDTIIITVRDKYLGQVQDAVLARGVLELYVGEKTVSPSLRKNLGCGTK